MQVILKFIHVVGLSIWLGSMVTWAVFAPRMNKYDATGNTTGILRNSFRKISWSSYAVSISSGTKSLPGAKKDKCIKCLSISPLFE